MEGSVAALLANLDVATERITHGAGEALVEFGHHVAGLASAASPVLSGDLRDSWLGGPNGIAEDGLIVGKDKHGNTFVEVGSNLPYASKIEYEDVPMLRPALHQSEADLQATIRAHVHTASGVVL